MEGFFGSLKLAQNDRKAVAFGRMAMGRCVFVERRETEKDVILNEVKNLGRILRLA